MTSLSFFLAAFATPALVGCGLIGVVLASGWPKTGKDVALGAYLVAGAVAGLVVAWGAR